MKYPFESQTDLKDCGVCCLQMLTRYYGGGVSREYLRNITHTTKDGVSAYSLIEGAKQLGFSAFGVKGKIINLKDEFIPCISHVVIKKSYQHFVVIYGINRKKKTILIADPSKKNLTKMSFSEFEKITTNQFILLKPYKKVKYIEKNTVLKDLIFNFISKYKTKLLYTIFISIIITFLNIICSFQLKFLMEYVIEYGCIKNLFLISFLFLYFIFIKELFSYYRNCTVNTLNHELDRSLLLDVYHHILSLPYLYYKNRTTGEIIARMNDIVNIRDVISKIFITLFLDFSLALFVFITLLFINIKLTLIVLLIVILFLIIMFIFQKPLDNNIQKSKQASSLLNSFMVETISGVETIRNQNIQSFIENNFLLKCSKYNKKSYFTNHLFIVEQFFKNFINEIGTFLVMIVGSYLVVTGELELTYLITFMALISYLLEPIKNIIDLNLAWKEAKISLKRLSELYEVEISSKVNHKKTVNKQLGNIDINNLHFSYNGKDLLLDNINLKVALGDRVLIYGSSGSGKSTLAKILAKQLNVDNNMVYIEARDINTYASDYNEKVSYISQQEILFTESVYQNIVLDKEVNYDYFLKIAKLCLIDEFVEKNILTYDMLLEENGFNISGGQRQRVILARSLLRNADIYILDEALNQVDIEKERQILVNLFNNFPDKTFIIISHRFHNEDLFNNKYCIEGKLAYEK